MIATEPAREASVVAVALIGWYMTLSMPNRNWPEPQGQISRTNLLARSAWGPFAYGVEAGVGFRTKVQNPTPFVLVALILGTGQVWFALAIAGGWALGRTLTPVAMILGRASQQEALSRSGQAVSSLTATGLVSVFVVLAYATNAV